MKNASFYLLALIIFFSSCQKEIDGSVDPNSPGTGGGGSNNSTPGCNSTIMKLKKWQSTSNTLEYIENTWNTDGTIKSIKMNVPLSEYRTANYVYANGKITEAILFDNQTNSLYDTVVFHYNAAGKVDSMYLKNDDWFDIALKYNSSNKLVKYTRYAAGDVMFYWDIVTDANDNITSAVEYWNGTAGFEKQSTYTFTRDAKKNPFAGLAPYMMYLDDDYGIFRYWGPNNYDDQRYQDHTGSGTDLRTGYKFTYNSSCYPISAQNTIMGQVFFPGEDYTFTY
jgi:hypothetical protein